MHQAVFSCIRNQEIFVNSNLPSLDHVVREFRTCFKDSELEYFQKSQVIWEDNDNELFLCI